MSVTERSNKNSSFPPRDLKVEPQRCVGLVDLGRCSPTRTEGQQEATVQMASEIMLQQYNSIYQSTRRNSN